MSRAFLVSAMLGTAPLAAQSPTISPAHPNVVVVPFGPLHTQEDRDAANQVLAYLDTARSAKYMSIVKAEHVRMIMEAADAFTIRTTDDLRQFATAARADLAIGVHYDPYAARSRVTATLIYTADAKPRGTPIVATDSTLKAASAAVARLIAADSVVRTRRCCR